MPANEEVRIEYVSVDELKRAARNPKEHATADIEASVKRFGFIDPLVINETTGLLVAGHGRLEVLQRMIETRDAPPLRVKKKGAKWLVPVVRIPFESEAEAEAYLLSSNRLTEKGGWNEDELATMLQDLREQDVSLDGVGYDGEELERLLAREVHALDPDDGEGAARGTNGAGLNEIISRNAVVKMVPIYMQPEQHVAFLEKVKTLAKEWGLENVSEVVVRVVEKFEP